MTTAILKSYDTLFRKYIGISLFIHISIVLVFTIKAAIFPDENFQYQTAVKVDLVALPDKLDKNTPLETEPEKPEVKEKIETPPPEVKSIPKEKKLTEKKVKKSVDPDAINLESTKKKEKAALEKLKQMNALEEIQKQEEQQEREKAKQKAIERLNKIKGNALSSGSDIKGVAKLQHENYIATVEKAIRRNWSLPEWLARKNLAAQVRVRFDENGTITHQEIEKSSGNPTFDELVMQTVQKSSPVPPPPTKFVRILNVEGILLGFPE